MRQLRRVVIPALIFVVTLGLYLATLTGVHTFDALSYILDVERKPWRELFHPHHLAYGPLGALVHTLAGRFGYSGSAGLPLQVTNAIAGAAGVALFFALVRRVGGRTLPAVAAALLLAGSYAYWYYAGEVEVYTIAALFLVGSLWLLVQLVERPTAAVCLGLGLMQGAAVLFHQTNVLLSIPALVALWLGTRRQPGERARRTAPFWRGLVLYGGALGLIVGGSYLLVGFGVSGFRSVEQFLAWSTKYAQTGWWGGAISESKWRGLGHGLTTTIAQPGGALIGAALLGLGLVYSRHVAHAHRRLSLVLLAWLASYGAFFFWWEPDNIEFWIASLPPALLLLALATGSSRRPVGAWAVLALGGLALALNLGSIRERGNSGTDLQRVIATELAAASQPGDLLLVPDGAQELYLPYYADRNNVLSLNQALFSTSGDWAAACALVQERIAATLQSGAAVVIAGETLQPDPTPRQAGATIINRFGLTPQQVRACFAAYQSGLAAYELSNGLGQYYRLAPTQELADGAGWDFTVGQWGWQGHNLTPAPAEQAGWTFTPGSDPWLLSPPFQLDMQRYQAIEIRLAASTAARDAQLFWLDERDQADEARAVRWTLYEGKATHTYRIELGDHPGWNGIATRLRLDPVSSGDGGTVRIEEIRLVPW